MKNFSANGNCGRIIRGQDPNDFLTLTDDPDRKIVMLMGPDGLSQIQGKTGYEALNIIGYEPDYIVRKVQEGNQFKLVTFPEGQDAILATWDNVAEIVKQVYPDVYSKISANLPLLKKKEFDEIERDAGYDFSEIDKNGKTDDRYMTYERYQDAGAGIIKARAFLYFTLHLRELFSGDGYTYDANGVKGLKEYFISNKPISDIQGSEIWDLDMQLP